MKAPVFFRKDVKYQEDAAYVYPSSIAAIIIFFGNYPGRPYRKSIPGGKTSYHFYSWHRWRSLRFFQEHVDRPPFTKISQALHLG